MLNSMKKENDKMKRIHSEKEMGTQWKTMLNFESLRLCC